jgi:putative DNA primase/helicase
MTKDKVLRPRFTLVAIAEDEATGEFFAVIKYRDLDGRVRRVILPRADVDDRKGLTKTLKNLGAYFSKVEEENQRALELMAADDAQRWKFAAKLGWYDGHRAFVLPKRVLGIPRGDASIRPPRKCGEHLAGLGLRGTHKEWLRTVAAHAQYSSRMVLGISAALGAPLLSIARLNSFGILVHGPGKSGKSTMLLAAGSVVGYGSEQDLPNFRTTDPAFGEIPVASNDSLLPLNELGLLKGSAAERRQRLRDLTYGFAEGRGTTYSKWAPIDKTSSGTKWHGIAFATGEEASDQIASSAGEIRMAGESIRWIDLAATRNGAPDIFDRIPIDVPEAERANWVEKRCRMIRDGCWCNHGVTIRHFINGVIRNRKTVAQDVQSLRDEFANRVINANDSPAVRHLAKCIGHIYAAAVIGVRYGTLPWSERLVRKCVVRCYRDARRELKTEADLLRQGLAVLHDKIRKLPKANATDLKHAEGFKTGGMMRDRATIRAEAFKGWFPDARQANVVLRWLRAENALPSRPALPLKEGPAIKWAESQPTWPDGTRRRSILINVRPDLFKSLKT